MRFLSFVFGALEFAFVFVVGDFFFCIRSLPGRRHWSGREGDGAIVWGYHLWGGGGGLGDLCFRFLDDGIEREGDDSIIGVWRFGTFRFGLSRLSSSRVYCFSLLPGAKRKGCGAVLDWSVWRARVCCVRSGQGAWCADAGAVGQRLYTCRTCRCLSCSCLDGAWCKVQGARLLSGGLPGRPVFLVSNTAEVSRRKFTPEISLPCGMRGRSHNTHTNHRRTCINKGFGYVCVFWGVSRRTAPVLNRRRRRRRRCGWVCSTACQALLW